MQFCTFCSSFNIYYCMLRILRKRQNVWVYKTCFNRNFRHPQLIQVHVPFPCTTLMNFLCMIRETLPIAVSATNRHTKQVTFKLLKMWLKKKKRSVQCSNLHSRSNNYFSPMIAKQLSGFPARTMYITLTLLAKNVNFEPKKCPKIKSLEIFKLLKY